MDVFSSYEVRNGSTKITTRIADSWELVTRSVEELTALISDYKTKIQSEKPTKTIVVGLDVYFDCVAMNLAAKNKKIATLQLCFGAHCLIIQLIHLEPSIEYQKLKRFFIHQNVVFVGMDIRNTVAMLEEQHDIAALGCRKMIELGALADRVCRRSEYYGSKLKKLALEIVGIDIEKPKNLIQFNWGARDLTSEQIEYAAIRAYASYAIGNKLLNA